MQEAERNLVIYVSREDQPTRRVRDEPALLEAIQAAFPNETFVVFDGNMTASDTIELFQHAKVSARGSNSLT